LKGRGFSRAAIISKGPTARLEAVPFQNSIADRVVQQNEHQFVLIAESR
jgi:hypothetical protein